MDNHIAKSLGKYLGKKVWHNIPLVSEYGTLVSINLRTYEVVVEEDGHSRSFKDLENIYPILKTSEDLTENEMYDIYGNLWHALTRSKKEVIKMCKDHVQANFGMGSYYPGLDMKHALTLLDKDYGAVLDPGYPTGYKSIHDGLICKRWEDVFPSFHLWVPM